MGLPKRALQPARGFTLLELVIAVTILATFLLPMMLIVTRSKVRAIRYTQQREVRDLAQRKLFDRIHYYEEKDSGNFSLEGHPSWTWEVSPPDMVGHGEQVLLQYTIKVHTPQNLDGGSASSSGSGSIAGSSGQEGSSYEMNLWSFPDARWYEEQEYLYQEGQYSPLYGSPNGNLGASPMVPGGNF